MRVFLTLKSLSSTPTSNSTRFISSFQLSRNSCSLSFSVSVQLARGQDKTAENLSALEEACKASKLNAIYDSLNCLGMCGWIVNGKILDIMIDIFNDKGSELLEIPSPDLPKLPEFKPELVSIQCGDLCSTIRTN